MPSPEPPRPFTPHTYMLVPTLSCQANCRYCFAPRGAGVMAMRTLRAAADTVARLGGRGRPLRVVFHGGEPLLAGKAFYTEALPVLAKTVGPELSFGIQSNLWALDREYCDLLGGYGVGLSTSLDGPQELCDAQRGEGYFRRTMAGVELARSLGFPVHAIATVTRGHVDDVPGILAFFAREGIPCTLRGAARMLGRWEDSTCLTMQETAALYTRTLEHLAAHPELSRVRDMEALVRAAFYEHSDLCTFSGCLGHYAAIAPDGSLYACQRYLGAEHYRLANVCDMPDTQAIMRGVGYRNLLAVEAATASACNQCHRFVHCHGGCLYERTVARESGSAQLCTAGIAEGDVYRRLFDWADIRLGEDMGRKLQGLNAPTPYLAMVGAAPHAGDALRAARTFVQAVRWGEGAAPPYAFVGKPRRREVYLNVTDRCPLRCAHCSVSAGEGGADMPVALAARAFAQAVALGYAAVSLNGGEPLSHPEVRALLTALANVRRGNTRLILNTNLYAPLTEAAAGRLIEVFDEIIVSLDGDEPEHDARRGPGAFAATAANLGLLAGLGGRAKLSVRVTLTQRQREAGVLERARAAAQALGVRSVYASQLLPLGRAAALPDLARVPAPVAEEAFFHKAFAPRDGCGVGSRLHITPDGSVYPCWGRMQPADMLGTVQRSLEGPAQAAEKGVPIDREPRCLRCRYRYVCGGLCRGYGDADCGERLRAYETLYGIACGLLGLPADDKSPAPMRLRMHRHTAGEPGSPAAADAASAGEAASRAGDLPLEPSAHAGLAAPPLAQRAAQAEAAAAPVTPSPAKPPRKKATRPRAKAKAAEASSEDSTAAHTAATPANMAGTPT